MQFCEIMVLRKIAQQLIFGRKKSEFLPSVFISKKKKNFENEKKKLRKTEIFFFSNEFFCCLGQNHDFIIS